MTASVALTENIVSSGPRPWWETRWFVVAMVLLAFVPLLYPPIPPLVDLPGHMGRFHVQMELAHSANLQRYYEYHWALVGNLGVDLLVIPLAKLFGLEFATKLIVLCIPPLTVAGFLWVAREVHNRIPPTALFALPFAFGHPFLFGFVNFALSMAFAFLAFGLWLRLGRLDATRFRAALFVPISFVVFIAHTFGWGALGLMAFSAEAIRQHDAGRSWWRAGFKAALHASCLAGPLLLLLLWRHEAQGGGNTTDWFNWSLKALWIESALRDRWFTYDRNSMLLAMLVPGIALFSKRFSFSRNLAFSACALIGIFALLPRIVFGSAYADMRLAPYLFAVALTAIRFRGETHLPTARVLAIAGLAFMLMRTTTTTISLMRASDDMQRELIALDQVKPGGRVLFLGGRVCFKEWALARKSQLGAMAIVRKDAMVNSEWQMPGAQLLTVRRDLGLGRWSNDPSQQVHPNECGNAIYYGLDRALATFPRGKFDYVWIVQKFPYNPYLVKDWEKLYEDRDSVLFRTATGRRSIATSETPTGNGTLPTSARSNPNTAESNLLTGAGGMRSSESSLPRHLLSSRITAIGG